MTGKVQIYMDGKEVHVTRWSNSYCGNTKFQHAWSIPGNHLLELVVNASSGGVLGEKKMLSQSWNHPQDAKHFDLLLDGMSYFNFLKIYELGGSNSNAIFGAVNQHSAMGEFSYNGPGYEDEQRDDEEEECQDESHYPTVPSYAGYDEDATREPNSNSRRSISSISKDIFKSLNTMSTRSLSSRQDSADGDYSLYHTSPISVMELNGPHYDKSILQNFKLPSFGESSNKLSLNIAGRSREDERQYIEHNTIAAATGNDFMQQQSTNEDGAASVSNNKSFALPKLSFSAMKKKNQESVASAGTMHDSIPWSPTSHSAEINKDAATISTSVNNTNQPKKGGGIFSIKRKLSKRLDSSMESRQPVDTYGSDGYVDHASSINRSPSAMSYDYELMRDNRSTHDGFQTTSYQERE